MIVDLGITHSPCDIIAVYYHFKIKINAIRYNCYIDLKITDRAKSWG